jgi:hypothetical protein
LDEIDLNGISDDLYHKMLEDIYICHLINLKIVHYNLYTLNIIYIVCGWGLHFGFRTGPLKSQERPWADLCTSTTREELVLSERSGGTRSGWARSPRVKLLSVYGDEYLQTEPKASDETHQKDFVGLGQGGGV